jgi:hypothetical protein
LTKRILAAFTLFLFAILGVHSTTLAAFQIGIERQVANEQQFTQDITNINWWLTDNWALRSNYSWNTHVLGVAALYKINPKEKAALYIGLVANDLSGKETPEIPFEQKTAIITGIEWDLYRIRPGLSLMIEAGINPNDLINKSNDNNGLAPSLGLSLNYRFPPTNTREKSNGTVATDLLAKLITLEAPDEPFEGQVAVAAVVLNRIRSTAFPDSVPNVIYQRGQFNTAQRLTKAVPSESAFKAARIALRGSDPSHGALYFYNPSICSAKARQYIKKSHFQVTARIGNHVFFK